MARQPRELQLATLPRGTWVQTDRRAHEQWAELAIKHPRAAALMHLLVANMGRSNALVVSQQHLARMAGCSLRTVQTTLQTLKAGHWIEVVQVGSAGTVNAYVINDRVAWHGKRDGLRYSSFSATVIAGAEEQPGGSLQTSQPLKKLPTLYADEQQLPTGEGLPPPSDQLLPGLEPDLPTRKRRKD